MQDRNVPIQLVGDNAYSTQKELSEVKMRKN